MMVKKTITDIIHHERIKATYSYYSEKRESEIKSRKDQVTLVRLRSGKHLAFQAYQNDLKKNVPP